MAILALVFLFNIGTLSNIGILGTALANEQPAQSEEEISGGESGNSTGQWVLGSKAYEWVETLQGLQKQYYCCCPGDGSCMCYVDGDEITDWSY